MGRNEIRLRRNMMSSGRIAQHRNYGEVMARHERDQKIKRVVRVFVYFLIIAILVILYFIVKNTEHEKSSPSKEKTTAVVKKVSALPS